jgi:hypothetical protein
MLSAVEFLLNTGCVTPLYNNNSMQQSEQISLQTSFVSKFQILSNIDRHFDNRRIAKQSLRQLKNINSEINLSGIQDVSNYRDVSLPRHDVRKVFTNAKTLFNNIHAAQVSDTTKMPQRTKAGNQKTN